LRLDTADEQLWVRLSRENFVSLTEYRMIGRAGADLAEWRAVIFRRAKMAIKQFISLEGVEEVRSMNDALGRAERDLQRTAKESTGFSRDAA
jgi:hypothetical protein